MIDEPFHIPVLTEEVIEHLIRKKDGHYLDATTGFGGHSSAILEDLDSGSLVAIDRDPEAIKYLNSKFQSEKRIRIHQACFSELNKLLDGEEFDGILAESEI